MKVLKILLLSPLPPPIGGIAKWTEHILSQYRLVSPNCNFKLLHMSTSNKVCFRMESFLFRLICGIINTVYLTTSFLLNLQTVKPNIVHLTSSASWGLIRDILFVRICKMYNAKIIVHFHFGRIPELYQKDNWEWKLLAQVVNAANLTLVIDPFSYKTLREAGFVKVDKITNPLSVQFMNDMVSLKETNRNSRDVLFVGHMLKTKGVFELIDACKTIPGVRLKMCGMVFPSVRKELLEYAGANNDWLDIVGEISYDKVLEEMVRTSVFVLPTYTEGFPNVILESMVCGCPIVASAVGAIPEMLNIDGDIPCGICVPPKDVKKLKDSIEFMLENQNFALKCGEQARKRVLEEYSISSVWKYLIFTWNKVC